MADDRLYDAYASSTKGAFDTLAAAVIEYIEKPDTPAAEIVQRIRASQDTMIEANKQYRMARGLSANANLASGDTPDNPPTNPALIQGAGRVEGQGATDGSDPRAPTPVAGPTPVAHPALRAPNTDAMGTLNTMGTFAHDDPTAKLTARQVDVLNAGQQPNTGTQLENNRADMADQVTPSGGANDADKEGKANADITVAEPLADVGHPETDVPAELPPGTDPSESPPSAEPESGKNA